MGRRPKPGSEKAPLRSKISTHLQRPKGVPSADLQQALERSREEERQSKKEERIETMKASLQTTTFEICENVGEDPNMDVKFSYPVVRALGESAYHYISSLARDLEMFAGHAKRVTVTTADVRMCARRSKSLHQRISFLAQQLAEKRQAAKPSKRTGGEDTMDDAVRDHTSDDGGIGFHEGNEQNDSEASNEY